MHFQDWNQVFSSLERSEKGKIIPVRKDLPHPASSGADRHFGFPRGQTADYRWKLVDCRSFHVQEFRDHWEAHIDQVDPRCDLAEHIRRDVPPRYLLASVIAIGLVGLLLVAAASD